MLFMIFLAIIALIFLSGTILRLLYRAETTHDELHFAETADGVRLALYRYLPIGEHIRPDIAGSMFNHGAANIPPSPDTRHPSPVILCHGLSSNRFTWDLPGASLARFLAEHGHDVWSLELRGGGKSKGRKTFGKTPFCKRGFSQTLSPKILDPEPSPAQEFFEGGRDFNFDDHVERDAPAAIAYVLKATGAEKIDWVGHSMGGILLYAYLTRFGGSEKKIRRGCAIGSPGTMRNAPKFFQRVTTIIPPPKYWPVIHTKFFLNFALPFVRLVLARDTFAANLRNVGARRATAMAVNMPENLSTRLTIHIGYMVRKGNIRQFPPGTFSYQDNIGGIETPLLLIAGAKDRLVPPPLVKYAHDNIASAEKRFIVFSRANGHSADYGHTDLVVGARAHLEVWPEIAKWLE